MALPRMSSVFLLEATEHAWKNLGYTPEAQAFMEKSFPKHAYEAAIIAAGMAGHRGAVSDRGRLKGAASLIQREYMPDIEKHAKLRADLRRNSARIASWPDPDKPEADGELRGLELVYELWKAYPKEEPEGYAKAETYLDLGEGWRWVKVEAGDCQGYEGELMQHCGKASNDMYSLRDAQGKPHATAELNFNRCAMRQLKGKQNDALDQKYWASVGVLLTHLRTKTGNYWQFDDPMYLNSKEGTDFLEYLERNKLAWDGWGKDRRFGAAVPAREFFGPDFPEQDL